MTETAERRAPEIPGVNTIADPAPLGLGAFAATTFALSLVNARVLPAESEPMVLPLALFYGGIAQVFAGLWEFRNNRNTFGATAFTSYGAFWVTFYLLVTRFVGDVPEDQRANAIGVYLLAWTVFTFYMWVGSFRLNGALVAVFTALLVTFALLTLGEFFETTWLTRLGGWIGVVTAILAWYTAAAVLINGTYQRTVLPVWPAQRRTLA
ncbi:MAG TPA: acetate uptake transporter [Actinomycetes bacterium]|nr:acetate uptake transporter [Actinomycetes bacterium]